MNVKSLVNKASPEEREEMLMELATHADELNHSKAQSLELVNASDFETEIKDEIDNWGKHRGLDFGIQGINDMTLGMTEGEILLLSGDSNHGKSQMAFNMAYQQAKQGKLVFFITLEMTKPQAASRLVKIAMQDGNNFQEAIALCTQVMFQKVNKLDYRMIKPIVERAKEDGAQIVFLDHVHYFSRSADTNKTSEVAAISMEIKRAALECAIPIVALCQCRKLDDGKGKSRKPTRNDLKDASELYQDCDICIMVWRDKDNVQGDHDLVEARIWKNRLRAMRKNHIVKAFRSNEGGMLVEVDYAVIQRTQAIIAASEKKAEKDWDDINKSTEPATPKEQGADPVRLAF